MDECKPRHGGPARRGDAVTELAALSPITESQLTNYLKNRKSNLARLAKEAAAARGAAGAAAVWGGGAAMAAGASSAASSSCGAAVYPSAPSAFSDYEDDKGLRRDGSGYLYKDVLRTDGVAERQWFAEKHAGNRLT